MYEILMKGDTSNDIVLDSGDIIFVPKALESAIEENLELLSLNFSPQKIKVNVAIGKLRRLSAINTFLRT